MIRGEVMVAVTVAVVALGGGCKGKQKSGNGSGSAAAAAADAAAAPVADAAAAPAAAAGSAAPAPPAPPPMPSQVLVADLPAGPMRSADGTRVVWCTHGDNGMADWVETMCHVAVPGKKTSVIPIMTYADAMTIDEGVDPAVDADAGVRAASAGDRVAAGIAKVKADGGADLVAMPAPIRCSFQGGDLVERSDGAGDSAAAPACDVGGVVAHISAPGKVTLTSTGKILLAEVLKARPRGTGDGGNQCYLEASHVELSVDAAAKLAVASIWMSNPSDSCALVTEFEVRAVKLP